MNGQLSDALVLFGATGDLAHKKIYPALQQLVKRGQLDVPVIGVSRGGWNLERLRARVRDSLEKHGGFDEAVFARLSGQLLFIDGDYGDTATFDRLCKTLGTAQRPLFYLAIPPSMFPTVVDGLGKLPCATEGRVVVEKPFGRSLASAQHLNKVLHKVFDESAIYRIDHYLGKEPVQNLLVLPLRQFVPGADLEPQLRRKRADHHGRSVRRGRPRPVLRGSRRGA